MRRGAEELLCPCMSCAESVSVGFGGKVLGHPISYSEDICPVSLMTVPV